MIVPVRPGDHVAPSQQRVVGQYPHIPDTDRTQRPCRSAEPILNLGRICRAKFDGTSERFCQLGLAQLVVAAQQRQHGLAVDHHHQALHLRSRRQAGKRGNFRDGLTARRVKFLGVELALGIGLRG